MPVALLDPRLRFPNPRTADPDGLVAVGGDLSVPRLLLAYRSGIFPWTVKPVTWWSPDPRAIFELDRFYVSRSLAKLIRQRVFAITRDQAFAQVMKGCAAPARGRRSTWITPEFIAAFTELHRQGHAHSLECWQGERLAGGIYGVALGGFFAGESMFHRVNNASKVALFHLIEHLRGRSFLLFDIQMLTPATAQLGGITLPREEYLKRLAQAVEKTCSF
jgi:leucyl/phenylalanyl-tRNA--protein transferase